MAAWRRQRDGAGVVSTSAKRGVRSAMSAIAAVARLQALGVQVQTLAAPQPLLAETWRETARVETDRPDVRTVVDTAKGLEGLRRSDGIHAAAVVIAVFVVVALLVGLAVTAADLPPLREGFEDGLGRLADVARHYGIARSTTRFAELRHHIYEQIQLAKAGVVPAQIAAGVTADDIDKKADDADRTDTAEGA